MRIKHLNSKRSRSRSNKRLRSKQSKYIRKFKRLRGGGGKIIEISEFSDDLIRRINDKDYDYVYITLGSLCSTSDPTSIYCIYQILPKFILKMIKEKRIKVLILIIDPYTHHYIDTRDIILPNMIEKRLKDDDNVDFALLNKRFTGLTVEQINKIDLSDDSVLIANYIKHRSPNDADFELENRIDDLLKAIKFTNVYTWYGYHSLYERFIIRRNYPVFSVINNFYKIDQLLLSGDEFDESIITRFLGRYIRPLSLTEFQVMINTDDLYENDEQRKIQAKLKKLDCTKIIDITE